MNRKQHDHLAGLLTELISAQDSVTHLNEKGRDYQKETLTAVAERNGVRAKILAYVDSITSNQPQHRGRGRARGAGEGWRNVGTYWAGSGKHQDKYDEIKGKIPQSGKAKDIHLDLVRNVANLYYDYYNNGGCNWDVQHTQFEHIAYYAEIMEMVANGEGFDIQQAIRDIRSIMNKTLEEVDEDEWGYTEWYTLTKDDKVQIEALWESLADTVISWGWYSEQMGQLVTA